MPYPTRNELNIFKTLKNGIKYTKRNGSFYVRNANDGKLRLYTKKTKTNANKIKTLTPSASSSSSRYLTAKSKSKSKSKSRSNSSALFRRNKTQKRLTISLRSGKLNRQLCGKNIRTNRCRFVRGKERTSNNCHLSSKHRCVKVPKYDRTKCGINKKTNRCQFLRRGSNTYDACKLSKRRCIKQIK